MRVSKKYLKIENFGTVPSEVFLILGASLADTCEDSQRSSMLIGKFGSGTKNSIAVLARAGLFPIVYSSTTKMSFYLENLTVSDELSSKELERICVERHSAGQNGEYEITTEKLAMTTDFGKHIWTDTSLALREFVSNAIDFSIRQKGNWEDVVIELVEEKDVKAKEGYTQIFVPLDEDVLKFWCNLGKWFLHFSEPESLGKTVLLKKDRNFDKTRKACIYRKGVFVKSIVNDEQDSLFDYNLPDLNLNEDRLSSDWDCKYEATLALNRCSDPDVITEFMLNTDKIKWEYTFDTYGRSNIKKDVWKEVYTRVVGDRVCTTSLHVERLKMKGVEYFVVSGDVFSILKDAGVRTYIDVLDQNEIDGMEFVGVPSKTIEMYGRVWDFLAEHHLTRNKSIPQLRCFVNGMNAGATTFGMCRNNEILLKDTLSGKELFKTIVEELTHFCSGEGDMARGFQEYLLDIIMCLVDKHEFSLE